MDLDYWEAMIDKGQWREFGQDTGVTPLLFTMSVMGFLMTTESQDLGLTSHPKKRVDYNPTSLHTMGYNISKPELFYHSFSSPPLAGVW